MDNIADTCSLTPQWEAPSTGQNKKQEQKCDIGLDKTHLKTYDNYLPAGVKEQDLKLQEEEFLKCLLLSRNVLI